MKVETVRDEIEAWRAGRETVIPPGFRNPRFWSAISMLSEWLEKRGILNAHIIRGTDAGAPVYMVAPEAWEAFVCEYACEPGATKDTMRKRWAREAAKDVPEPDRDEGFDAHWRGLEEHCVELLQVLLPGARVATEVGEYVEANDIYTHPWVDSAKQSDLIDGMPIAILADTREEAGE